MENVEFFFDFLALPGPLPAGDMNFDICNVYYYLSNKHYRNKKKVSYLSSTQVCKSEHETQQQTRRSKGGGKVPLAFPEHFVI